ncbi:MarR family transcriptional regulator [Erwinia rhapontici]|uniref:MarR family transcriptional regulator n=1 Tax=Erwinia rhapontici TaxID=55212 RepID=UPI00105DB81B|nr:helix-turn-helix domain-containing protein [Erwinia rhapontici]TDS98326.1 hypothetical protein EDF84_10613 [Erwinia rhapontici]
MSKCKNAILNAMAGGEWMSSTQIAKICGFPKETVKASLNNMQRTGLAVKKDDPEHRPFVLWKKSEAQSGFGVSDNIAVFDKCLRGVRQ